MNKLVYVTEYELHIMSDCVVTNLLVEDDT